jgi:hypothetical protein
MSIPCGYESSLSLFPTFTVVQSADSKYVNIFVWHLSNLKLQGQNVRIFWQWLKSKFANFTGTKITFYLKKNTIVH